MWSEISNIGDAALTLPIALTCAAWLALTDWRLAARWGVLLAAGMGLVGATKILYAGCGIVAGSDPESEVAESDAKLVPMRDALASD